ncbi:MFS transporter, FLVCR family, disrupted in renal carcinoma protein 2 [Trypanosoma conorhini]|uniref:MFS transporter, FLVCR family, disrupted in renal carcinoma protein 2 n=1 Tax=Trypanosoma conorhini TaxID=83891 RepID=A0A422QAC6_9TRYP|nr:MFS transporter, FLVCR family, disrupted in renal carcinoma protein 2 [Trypanosoma conorhini]RNF26918.1 MFS transporter, FLVCR family, disrupted in renal carcinoma protein 2 [Trypanosoma conorhini]
MADVGAMLARRYKVLIIFVLFTLNNGFAWLMFDPVAGRLEKNVKGLTVAQLQVLSSWQPLMFLLMFLPVMKMVTRPDGLRKAVRLGATCELLGAVFKIVGSLARKSYAGLVLLHVGQIFSGVGSPVATGCVSALSAVWFGPTERTRATAAAVLSNSVGNALAYIFVPAITESSSFVFVTVYEAAMAAIAAVFVWFCLPAQKAPVVAGGAAETSPSDGVAGEEKSLRGQLRQLLGTPSVVFLLLIYSWSAGGFSAWISLFDATYNRFFSESFIGLMSFAGMVAYVVGGLVSSWLTDLCFPRQMKYVIFLCITCNSVSNILFVASAPNNDGYSLYPPGRAWIGAVTALCGFWNGAAAPLFYELIAEISYPVDEGVSGIAVSVCENLGALFFYQVVSRFYTGESMSVAYSIGMTVAVALSAAVRQRYNRSYHVYLQYRQAASVTVVETDTPTV